jgi:hypothetical protein
MRNIATISLAFGFAFAVSPVFAADVKSEIMTAEQHAELAAQAQSLDAVQMHLHHTLNCIVGPKGAEFDAKELNPCANSGAGALVDSTDAAAKQKLKAAVAKANTGLKETVLASAQKDAADTANILETAK